MTRESTTQSQGQQEVPIPTKLGRISKEVPIPPELGRKFPKEKMAPFRKKNNNARARNNATTPIDLTSAVTTILNSNPAVNNLLNNRLQDLLGAGAAGGAAGEGSPRGKRLSSERDDKVEDTPAPK